jgi:hypothetical protein
MENMKAFKLIFCSLGFHSWKQMSIKHRHCKWCGKQQVLDQFDEISFWADAETTV